MPLSKKLALQGTVALALSALALTGCTNASETGAAQPASSGTVTTFDPSTVKKDDSLASQVPAAIKSRGTLMVGSDTTYAPAEFLGGPDNHTPMGYDVDLAKAIGAKLGLKVDVQTAEFAGILPALGPKYDLGVSSFLITKKRLAAVNFVGYFDSGTLWAVQKGNPKKFSLDDVCGKTIGVETGTVQEEPDLKDRNDKCVKAGKSPINVVSLKSQTDITTRLVNGTLDAMVSDSPTIGYAAQQTNGAVEKLGDTYNSGPGGIAIAKDDPALANLVAQALNKLIDDGTYKKILSTWNVADGAVPKAEVNPSLPS
ncbi:ABC transporter substrate-binding protein [Sinomonas sp. ASV322]|uniref:ABC transporter substrate-binding protein n=1 Tax=Sinomonas sp. ASV322 TaxID=3041920 RepID=UPI0027DC8CD7|nr:ABC transporter substrate-binding protein [Sinomonas sp. ASV322]MDQ4504003.1 ABC transporter substrate-binding protein [Sinomonas sp. ASV322]